MLRKYKQIDRKYKKPTSNTNIYYICNRTKGVTLKKLINEKESNK